MAIPRIFISSTYYDLKHVRNELGDFIKGLGYDAVMHDKGKVTYRQNETLENSCYNEIQNCDILVCIIGQKYGTRSSENDYSITMNELNNAIKARKKIYVFIAKDVYIENNTYAANRDTGQFKAVYADDIKIHEYIFEIKSAVLNHPITPFENVNEIMESLRNQFAGMFQNFLRQEATLSESKTYYDLEKISNEISNLVSSMRFEKDEFFYKFSNSIFATNYILNVIRKKIGMKSAIFFAKDKVSLVEIMEFMGYAIADDMFGDAIVFTKDLPDKIIEFKLLNEAFDKNGDLKDIRNKSEVDRLLLYEEKEIKKFENIDLDFSSDDDIPF